MADRESDFARLEESLRQCRRELAALREQQESREERLAPLEFAEQRLHELATAVNEHLSGNERPAPGLKGWIKRRLVPEAVAPAEVADLVKIRKSPLFDAEWYLTHYPDVVLSGLSPALHYLRHGGAERRDPGPHFDARAYAKQHGLPRRANPLLHYQASVPGVAS